MGAFLEEQLHRLKLAVFTNVNLKLNNDCYQPSNLLHRSEKQCFYVLFICFLNSTVTHGIEHNGKPSFKSEEPGTMTNHMKFNKGRCQILHQECGSPAYMDRSENEMLESRTAERHLGVLVNCT